MRPRHLLRRLALTSPASRLARRLTQHEILVLVLHRIGGDVEEGPTAEVLRKSLEWMRSQRSYSFLPLGALFREEPLTLPVDRKIIVFTIDDGYREQVEVVGELLLRFEVPSTLFVTSGFVDRSLWMWWDRVRFALLRSPRRELPALAPSLPALTWTDDIGSRLQAAAQLAEALKSVPEGTRLAVLENLSAAADVLIPHEAPPDLSPASWDDLRKFESTGLGSLAPHSVTHPILSQLGDAESEQEIRGSWTRLQQEARSPLPVFAFPNGTARDFGARELSHIVAAGLAGSVSTIPGEIARDRHRVTAPLPRFPFPYALDDVRMLVSGASSLWGRIRRD